MYFFKEYTPHNSVSFINQTGRIRDEGRMWMWGGGGRGGIASVVEYTPQKSVGFVNQTDKSTMLAGGRERGAEILFIYR